MSMQELTERYYQTSVILIASEFESLYRLRQAEMEAAEERELLNRAYQLLNQLTAHRAQH